MLITKTFQINMFLSLFILFFMSFISKRDVWKSVCAYNYRKERYAVSFRRLRKSSYLLKKGGS